MDVPDFLRFDPAPVRARSNGWAPAVQRRFVLHLARGAGPSETARHVGRTKQTAYALRARPGAESFAAAWDAAVAFATLARDARRVPGPMLTQCGLETMLVPRFYRGRLVGFVQREDHYRALRTLKQIDRAADRAAGRTVDPSLYRDALRTLGGIEAAETDQTDRMDLRTT